VSNVVVGLGTACLRRGVMPESWAPALITVRQAMSACVMCALSGQNVVTPSAADVAARLDASQEL
jgi:hypothetical protein